METISKILEKSDNLELKDLETYVQNVHCPVCLKLVANVRLYTFVLDFDEKPIVSNEIIYHCCNPSCLISYFKLS